MAPLESKERPQVSENDMLEEERERVECPVCHEPEAAFFGRGACEQCCEPNQ